MQNYILDYSEPNDYMLHLFFCVRYNGGGGGAGISGHFRLTNFVYAFPYRSHVCCSTSCLP